MINYVSEIRFVFFVILITLLIKGLWNFCKVGDIYTAFNKCFDILINRPKNSSQTQKDRVAELFKHKLTNSSSTYLNAEEYAQFQACWLQIHKFKKCRIGTHLLLLLLLSFLQTYLSIYLKVELFAQEPKMILGMFLLVGTIGWVGYYIDIVYKFNSYMKKINEYNILANNKIY